MKWPTARMRRATLLFTLSISACSSTPLSQPVDDPSHEVASKDRDFAYLECLIALHLAFDAPPTFIYESLWDSNLHITLTRLPDDNPAHRQFILEFLEEKMASPDPKERLQAATVYGYLHMNFRFGELWLEERIAPILKKETQWCVVRARARRGGSTIRRTNIVGDELFTSYTEELGGIDRVSIAIWLPECEKEVDVYCLKDLISTETGVDASKIEILMFFLPLDR